MREARLKIKEGVFGPWKANMVKQLMVRL
jgi:hypothetical protein